MKCKYCGCTDEKACEGGCYWWAPNICSNRDCVLRALDDAINPLGFDVVQYRKLNHYRVRIIIDKQQKS